MAKATTTFPLDVPAETLEVLAEEAPKECRTSEQLAAWVLICWAREVLKKRPTPRVSGVTTLNGATYEASAPLSGGRE